MLVVENLHVHYGRLAAVKGLSFEIQEGEIICVVGPNGAGKSTTLATISGVLSPSEGTIRFEDRMLTGIDAEDVVRKGISLVPEGRRIFGRLTVEENLLLSTFMRRDKEEIRTHLKSVIDVFPFLGERLSYPAGKLSGGEQQQLAIARALLARPKLLLVDEPALGLAPMLVELVYETLTNLRDNGLTMLIVEQSLERALRVADRIYVMRNGMVQISGRAKDLEDGRKLEEAYFGFHQE